MTVTGSLLSSYAKTIDYNRARFAGEGSIYRCASDPRSVKDENYRNPYNKELVSPRSWRLLYSWVPIPWISYQRSSGFRGWPRDQGKEKKSVARRKMDGNDERIIMHI